MRAEAGVPKLVRENRQPEEKKEVERPPKSEHEGIVEEQVQILGPALNHGAGSSVHAGGNGVVGIAKAQSNPAALGDVGQLYVFEDLARDARMPTHAPVG